LRRTAIAAPPRCVLPGRRRPSGAPHNAAYCPDSRVRYTSSTSAVTTSPPASTAPQGRGRSRRGPTSAGLLRRPELRAGAVLGLPTRSPSRRQLDMGLWRAGALQQQSGSDALGPAEESWHGTVCWPGCLAGADLDLRCRRQWEDALAGEVRLHSGGDGHDHPREGARGGAHWPGERSLIGVALARAEEVGTACGLPGCPARQGSARPAAEQVRPE
jgi:hypothetical protein